MTHQSKIDSSFFIGSLNKNRSIICLLSLFFLTILAIAVLEKRTDLLDGNILDWLQQFKDPLLTNLSKGFYFIGDEYFAGAVVIVSIILLYHEHRRQEAKFLAVGSLGILIIIDLILKPFFDRPRPLERLASDIIGYSFPSGHVAGNFFLYFYLARLLATLYPDRAKSIYTGASAIVVLIGLSTLYLRVHWPTDVIASYGVGYIWLTTCLTMLKLAKKTHLRSKLAKSNNSVSAK